MQDLSEKWGALTSLVGGEFVNASGKMVYAFSWAPGLQGRKILQDSYEHWGDYKYLHMRREYVFSGEKLITKTDWVNMTGWDKPAASCVAKLPGGAIIFKSETGFTGIASRINQLSVHERDGTARLYNRTAGATQAIIARYTKPRDAGGGSGIGGALLGAAIGGVLSGGSAEGIINGARAMSSDDGARQVYQEYESQRIAQEQEAADVAATAARVRGYSRSVSDPAGTSAQPTYGSTASSGGNRATQATAPVTRRPLRLFLSVVPSVGDKDKSQPVCLSNVLDLGQVANWPDANGIYQDGVAYDAARPLFASFVALCRNARGDMRTVSPASVSITSNAYAGTDLDDERSRVISVHTPNAYWLVTM